MAVDLFITNVLTLTAVLVVHGSSITLSLNHGVCMCVNEPNVMALKDLTVDVFMFGVGVALGEEAANPTTSVGALANGACFTSNGGIYHGNGNTYYELKDGSNAQVAWVDSFYLTIATTDHCSGAHATKQAHHVPNGQPIDCHSYGKVYAHGQNFSVHGLHCTCDDGAAVCSFTGQNCFEDGLVYQHGSAVSISGRGSCTCSQGSVQCNIGK